MKALFAILCLSAAPAMADPARILAAEAVRTGDTWRLSVTLEHDDTGWDDYADGWRVELADGTVLGTRVLAHPHVDEQPFTRALAGVGIPVGTSDIHIRARTSRTGWAEDTRLLPLD